MRSKIPHVGNEAGSSTMRGITVSICLERLVLTSGRARWLPSTRRVGWGFTQCCVLGWGRMANIYLLGQDMDSKGHFWVGTREWRTGDWNPFWFSHGTHSFNWQHPPQRAACVRANNNPSISWTHTAASSPPGQGTQGLSTPSTATCPEGLLPSQPLPRGGDNFWGAPCPSPRTRPRGAARSPHSPAGSALPGGAAPKHPKSPLFASKRLLVASEWKRA